MEYKYPQINRYIGYAFNIMQRILEDVGTKPTASGDSSGFTFVSFATELTPEQKAKLDTLMANDPNLPPPPKGSVFIIKDIWSQKSTIETAMGQPYRLYYSSSQGNNVIDQIEIHFDSALTTTQRNKIISEYSKLITLK